VQRGLPDATTYTKSAFESVAFAAAAAPALDVSLTIPLTKAYHFLEQKEAKEAEVFTCKRCPGKYTDATDSGGTSKRNYGVCSSKCREAAKKAKTKRRRRPH
jgi:hypothetical protein